jgi:hypothetical protein
LRIHITNTEENVKGTENVPEWEFNLSVDLLIISITDVYALAVDDATTLTLKVQICWSILDALREGERQPCAGVDITENDISDTISGLISTVPRVHVCCGQ